MTRERMADHVHREGGIEARQQYEDAMARQQQFGMMPASRP
jgi:hypothetical protein